PSRTQEPVRHTTNPTRRPTIPGPKPSQAPPRRVAVPPVAGLSGAEACNRVTQAELTCLPPVTRQDGNCETGKALASVPAAGSLVAPRTRVTVFVCGP